jgi:hypothetical protein
MSPSRTLSCALLLLVLAAACGERPTAALGRQVSGCAEAVRERAAADAAIDAAEKQATQRNRARATELQGIAAEGKHGILAAADLAPCDASGTGRGVAVDLADLRARYRVVIERTTERLKAAAAQPVPPPANDRGRGNEKSKDGTKD